MIDPSELLFSVDEHNNPIEPQPRDISHQQKIWHRVAHIWVVNEHSEVLCQKRSRLKDINPGMWEPFFGGHLHPGQSYVDGAASELGEELGIKVTPENLEYIEEITNPAHPEFVGVFIYRVHGNNDNFTFEADEVDEIAWVPKTHLLETIHNQDPTWSFSTYPTNNKIFDHI